MRYAPPAVLFTALVAISPALAQAATPGAPGTVVGTAQSPEPSADIGGLHPWWKTANLLYLGLILLAVAVGLWFYRRHRRKRG